MLSVFSSLDLFDGHCRYMANIPEKSPRTRNNRTSLRVQVKAHSVERILTFHRRSLNPSRDVTEIRFIISNHEDGATGRTGRGEVIIHTWKERLSSFKFGLRETKVSVGIVAM
jgi:hypothetical protein